MVTFDSGQIIGKTETLTHAIPVVLEQVGKDEYVALIIAGIDGMQITPESISKLNQDIEIIIGDDGSTSAHIILDLSFTSVSDLKEATQVLSENLTTIQQGQINSLHVVARSETYQPFQSVFSSGHVPLFSANTVEEAKQQVLNQLTGRNAFYQAVTHWEK